MEFTSRYEALGMDLPDPATMCKGDCEGVGLYPVAVYLHPAKDGEARPADESLTPYELAAWHEAEAKNPNEPGDAYHFITCPDCHGTGKATGERRSQQGLSKPSKPKRQRSEDRMTPETRARLEQLAEAWRMRAEKADAIADMYRGDSAGNGFAFMKEQRVWTTCVNQLTALLSSLEPPQALNAHTGAVSGIMRDQGCFVVSAEPPQAQEPIPAFEPAVLCPGEDQRDCGQPPVGAAPGGAGMSEGVIDYPFQLRPDLFVHLLLPRNLTREEVQKISAFLQLLAEPPSVPPPGGAGMSDQREEGRGMAPADRERIEAIREELVEQSDMYARDDVALPTDWLERSAVVMRDAASQLSALTEALTACQQERDRLRARTHEMQERHDKALVEERKHRDRAELDRYRSCFDEANKALIASDGGASKCGYVTESLWNRSVFLILRTRAEQAEAALTACRAQGEAMAQFALKFQRREHDRALGAHPMFSVDHWQHHAPKDWPELPDDESYLAFENCIHPDCAKVRAALSSTPKEPK